MRLIIKLSIAFSLLTSGCRFKQFFQTERDLQKHYQKTGKTPKYRQITLSGKNLFYAEMSGPAGAPLLVMIHGAPGAWYGYLKQMDDSILNQHFTMLAPDRLGYGHSDQGFSVPSIAAQSEVIAEMIRKEKQGRKVILMGRSFGSPIAAYIAATYPECADALVLVSSAADPQAEKYFKAGKLADPGCLLHGCVPTAMRVANDEKHIHAAELKKILYIWQHIRQPVEILQATYDQIVYYRNAVFLDSALVNAPHHLIKIKQGGHLITYQHPELVRETLLRLKNKL